MVVVILLVVVVVAVVVFGSSNSSCSSDIGGAGRSGSDISTCGSIRSIGNSINCNGSSCCRYGNIMQQ